MGKRHTKKTAINAPEHDAGSAKLRLIRNWISAGDKVQALQSLNTLLGTANLSNRIKVKAMCLLGDSEISQGRTQSARTAFQSAINNSTNDARTWLRPHLGVMLSFIADAQITNAQAKANSILVEAGNRMTQYQQGLQNGVSQVAQTGQGLLPAKPWRISVVGSRIGNIFLRQGELSVAKGFFQKAITDTPQGACRARIGMGEISLREGSPAEAQSYLESAITNGLFKTKTLAAIPLLLKSRKDGGLPIMDETVWTGYKSARFTVRARAVLSIIKVLREIGDSRWKSLSGEWLQLEPTRLRPVAVEIKKLLLADEKRALVNPGNLAILAADLLSTPKLSRSEWLAGAKELIRSQLKAGQAPNITTLIDQGRILFGVKFVAKLSHSLALATLEASRPDLAVILFQSSIQKAINGTSTWGKAVWALAKLRRDSGAFDNAAFEFDRVASHSNTPPRFAVQARLEWAKCLVTSGKSEQILFRKNDLLHLLNQQSDYSVLLDFGRQLKMAPAILNDLFEEVANRAEAAAEAAFISAVTPDEANRVLVKLARRQVLDFNHSRKCINFHKSLSTTKLNWLWSENSDFWEYISLVLQAFDRKADMAGEEELAAKYLEDSATPPEGLVQVGITHANILMLRKQTNNAFSVYEQVLNIVPSSPMCAWAHYWLALRAIKNDSTELLTEHTDGVLRSLGNAPALLWQWQLEARALLLKVNLQAHSMNSQYTRFSQAELIREVNICTRDLQKL